MTAAFPIECTVDFWSGTDLYELPADGQRLMNYFLHLGEVIVVFISLAWLFAECRDHVGRICCFCSRCCLELMLLLPLPLCNLEYKISTGGYRNILHKFAK